MEIGPLKNSRPMQPSANTKNQAPEPKPDQVVGDRVEISDGARQKLAELASLALKELENEKAGAPEDRDRLQETQSGVRKSESVDSSNAKDSSRMAEIRRRIESGYYTKPEVRDRIADKLTDQFLD